MERPQGTDAPAIICRPYLDWILLVNLPRIPARSRKKPRVLASILGYSRVVPTALWAFVQSQLTNSANLNRIRRSSQP